MNKMEKNCVLGAWNIRRETGLWFWFNWQEMDEKI